MKKIFYFLCASFIALGISSCSIEDFLTREPINEFSAETYFASEAELEDPSQQMRMEEKAVFHEADALQFEMGNIVSKVGASGNVLYDTPRNSMHKDRYSSLAMGNDYISELEKENIKKYKRGKPCVGLATYF